MGYTITMSTTLLDVDEGSVSYTSFRSCLATLSWPPTTPWHHCACALGGGLDASLAQGTGSGLVRSIVVVMNMAVQQASRAGTKGSRTMTWIETLAPSRGSWLGSL